MNTRIPLLICLGSLLASCTVTPPNSTTSEVSSSSEPSQSVSSSTTSSESSTTDTSSESVSSSAPSSSSADSGLPQDFSSVFSYGANVDIRITATPEAFTFISEQQSYSDAIYSEIYIPADLTIDIDGTRYEFEEAGIRMKGNTSRHSFYDPEYGFYGMVHFKVSLKATFDGDEYSLADLEQFRHDWSEDPKGRKTRKDRNLLGIEKFDLKFVPRNQAGGSCFLREIYAYQSFRDFGIDAPYANVAHVELGCGDQSINGSYEIIETIDKQFLKRRYGKDGAKGDLYKCVYNGMGKADFSRSGAIDKDTGERIPEGRIGVEDKLNRYVPTYQLKTNDDLGEGSDFSAMANLIRDVHKCAYGNGDRDLLESIVDMDQFLKMSAVSFLLGNFDDQRYNYNNYYIYFRPEDNKAIMLPYDWDWCLGLDLGYGLAEKDPLDGWTLDGGTNHNLYQATILPNEYMAYDATDYRNAFLADVLAAKDIVLDTQKYVEFAQKFGKSESEETADVLSYMEIKAKHCA